MDVKAASLSDILERIVHDENEDPTNLPAWLLESITNNFSDEQHIGSGGFADVYKGQLPNGIIIAIKKLKPDTSQMVDVHEKKFMQEVDSLMKVSHKNIVRFLGYCSDTQGKVLKHQGENIMAEKRQRFLCFQYMPEGSLDKYISDASGGLEWRTRYQIIRGICEGLHYLHNKKIVHSDLKPANILLDHKLVPKISDFGLARTFNDEQTRAITNFVCGSLGYMAPESFRGVITFKSDIYSLGVIIREILEGPGTKVDPSVENVVKSWSTRFTLQEATWSEHVRVCADIGLQCVDYDQVKRPSMADIIKKLDDLEKAHGFVGTDDDLLAIPFTEGLDVHPLEVRFPWKPKRLTECPVILTNKTDHKNIGVWITPTYRNASSSSGHGFPFRWEAQCKDNDKGSSLFRRLKPHSSMAIFLTMTKQQQRPQQAYLFDVVMFITRSWRDLRAMEVELTNKEISSKDSLKRIKEIGTVVYRATLSAVTCDPPRGLEAAVTPLDAVTGELIGKEDLWGFRSMDVHPTETWVMVGHSYGKFSIWNYLTQERVLVTHLFDDGGTLPRIESVKFIVDEQWFALGDTAGSVHVCAYTTNNWVKKLEAHSGNTVIALAVHPTKKLLLTAADTSIKVWDWAQDWTCVREFDAQEYVHRCLKVGPKDTSTFVSLDTRGTIKVWDFYSLEPVATFKNHMEPHIYSVSNGHFLASRTQTFADYQGVKIWDMQTKEHIHTLVTSSVTIREVACHPTLPILATITRDRNADERSEKMYILLWDTRTYRFLKKVEVRMGDYRSITGIVFDGTEELIRIMVRISIDKISRLETNLPMLKTDL